MPCMSTRGGRLVGDAVGKAHHLDGVDRGVLGGGLAAAEPPDPLALGHAIADRGHDADGLYTGDQRGRDGHRPFRWSPGPVTGQPTTRTGRSN
jgi:hypothetical protein